MYVPKRIAVAIAAVLALIIVSSAFAAGAVLTGKPDWWKKAEKTSDAIAASAFTAVPYPLASVQAGGFLERKNVSERLKRFSSANKIGYLYLMSFGKFVGYYVVKGKISSVESQLTNTNQVWDAGSGEQGETVVDSIGDDGSFGPNEGGTKGVFFFTASGTMVETTLDWVYSDQPLKIDVPNLLGKK